MIPLCLPRFFFQALQSTSIKVYFQSVFLNALFKTKSCLIERDFFFQLLYAMLLTTEIWDVTDIFLQAIRTYLYYYSLYLFDFKISVTLFYSSSEKVFFLITKLSIYQLLVVIALLKHLSGIMRKHHSYCITIWCVKRDQLCFFLRVTLLWL